MGLLFNVSREGAKTRSFCSVNKFKKLFHHRVHGELRAERDFRIVVSFLGARPSCPQLRTTLPIQNSLFKIILSSILLSDLAAWRGIVNLFSMGLVHGIALQYLSRRRQDTKFLFSE